jgi:hypothetical protein
VGSGGKGALLALAACLVVVPGIYLADVSCNLAGDTLTLPIVLCRREAYRRWEEQITRELREGEAALNAQQQADTEAGPTRAESPPDDAVSSSPAAPTVLDRVDQPVLTVGEPDFASWPIIMLPQPTSTSKVPPP